MRPHRRQPTRLHHPWDSPGKNTGVGCHFLLQCMKVTSEREVAQLCLTLSDPTDCSPPGFSVHGVFQSRVLEWGAIAFSDSPTSGCQWSLGSEKPCRIRAGRQQFSSFSSVVGEATKWSWQSYVPGAPACKFRAWLCYLAPELEQANFSLWKIRTICLSGFVRIKWKLCITVLSKLKVGYF